MASGLHLRSVWLPSQGSSRWQAALGYTLSLSYSSDLAPVEAPPFIIQSTLVSLPTSPPPFCLWVCNFSFIFIEVLFSGAAHYISWPRFFSHSKLSCKSFSSAPTARMTASLVPGQKALSKTTVPSGNQATSNLSINLGASHSQDPKWNSQFLSQSSHLQCGTTINLVGGAVGEG